jgi:hypothetical protein
VTTTADHPVVRRCLGRPTVVAAWLVLLVAAVHPPHGLGVPVCWTATTADLPCPGCGLTRSMSCAARGLLAESVAYHPFGVVFLAVFALVGVAGVLPSAGRRRVRGWVTRRRGAVHAAYVAIVASFIVFGIARAACHLAT